LGDVEGLVKNGALFNYNAQERQISLVQRDSEGNLISSEEWVYDDWKLVKNIYTDADGSVRVTEYDATGRIVGQSTYA